MNGNGKYEAGKVYMVPIVELRAAAWNPTIRTENVGVLAESMKQYGQKAPIIANSRLQIGDGHRRTAAAELLGWPEVAVFIAEGSQAETFRETNTTSRTLSGKESMQSYLNGGPRAGTLAIKQMELMEWAVGKEGMQKVLDKDFGPGVISVATSLVRWCGRDTKSKRTMAKALWYLVNHSASNVIRAVIDGHISMTPNKLWTCVDADVDLPVVRRPRRMRNRTLHPRGKAAA